MPTSFQTAIHLRPALKAEEVPHRLVRSISCFADHGLEPFPFTLQAWTEGNSGVLGSTSLVQSHFAETTGDRFWGAGFLTLPAPHVMSTLVIMETPAKPDEEALTAWQWLVRLIEPLCDSIQADLAMASGVTVTPKGQVMSGLIAGKEVAPGYPPAMLYPWIYFGPRRLNEDPHLAERLATLPAARTGPTVGGGWILEAHTSYSAHPPKDLLVAYQEAFCLPEVIWQGIE